MIAVVYRYALEVLRINAGEMEYIDIHLSHVAQFVWSGFLGKLDVAVVEDHERLAGRGR